VVVRCRECDAPALVYLGEADTYGDGVAICVYKPWYSTAHDMTFTSKKEEKAWCAANNMVPVDEKHLDDLQKYKKDESWEVDDAAVAEGIQEIEARKVAGTWNSETQDAFVAKHSSSSGAEAAE
jgi:hypothetical protein